MAKREETKHTEGAENILIEEGKTVDICGWHVALDSIWIHEGTIKADLMMWSDSFKKPLTGGYEKGTPVKIGTTECTYHVAEIKKYGKNNEKPGYVVLSRTRPESTTTIPCPEEEIIEETTRAKIGDVEFGLGNIRKSENGALVAPVHPPANSLLGGGFTLREGDTLWVGECAYKVEKIIDGHTARDGRYVNGCIVLGKLEQKLTDGSPPIPGELISQPPFGNHPHPQKKKGDAK